ncbi:amidase [Leisingera daeponensis]|uniref:amidase n=1 Tax=Leisingera daeponensis TaxID=405746 RepID=UPI001C93C9BD|nr:amidase family protein [Leisingera daeponensis]MBY6059046.1 amidase [Leisingera daeponensis]
MTDLADLGAMDLARGYRRNEFSPVEVMQDVLARTEARRDLNAFVSMQPEAALEGASAAETLQQKGGDLPVLHGLPYSVKDLTLTRGVATTMGSKTAADFVPDEDAVAVARARAAGAIMFGKTTTPEFGHKIHTSSPLFGRTLNPHSPDVTPGGSSGGAAVALAAGMGPIALGTDGGGSVRIPSACCGTVGLKPTLGSVPNLQAGDLFSSNVHVAPMARNVADTRLLFDVIRGFDRRDPFGQAQMPALRRCQSLKGLRIAWLPQAGNPVDHSIAALSAKAIAQLAAEGAEVEEIELDFAALEPHFMVVLETLLAARAGAALDTRRADLDPTLVVHVENGHRHSALDLAAAGAARTRAFKQVQEVLARFDLIASPTLSAPPLPHSQDPHEPVLINGIPARRVRASWYPYTFATNMTGHPSISIPCCWDSTGLPVGFHMTAPWYQEDFLLDAAALAEQVFDFNLAAGH